MIINIFYVKESQLLKNINSVKRILLYTHNITGLGHAFRSLAVIKGIKKWRPHIDFLVMSGSSVPHIFLKEGIEVVKLPGIKMKFNEKISLKPRYLKSTHINNIFDYRQKLIIDTFDFFKPQVLIVEHNMNGLMNEVVPLILKKSLRLETSEEFLLVYLSRGILKGLHSIKSPCNNYHHRAGSLDIAGLYDLIYVLENSQIVDFNKEFLGDDSLLEKKIYYTGPVSSTGQEELLHKKEVEKKFGLSGKPVILINLSRHGKILEMIEHFMTYIMKSSIKDDYEIIIVMDPYLDRETEKNIRSSPLCRDILFLYFTPHFVDLINISELVICRAGYNIVNEVLMTGTKALIIPEHHVSGEQERRVKNIPSDNITVKTEAEILECRPDEVIIELLKRKKKVIYFNTDKYRIGKKIIEDIEELLKNRQAGVE